MEKKSLDGDAKSVEQWMEEAMRASDDARADVHVATSCNTLDSDSVPEYIRSRVHHGEFTRQFVPPPDTLPAHILDPCLIAHSAELKVLRGLNDTIGWGMLHELITIIAVYAISRNWWPSNGKWAPPYAHVTGTDRDTVELRRDRGFNECMTVMGALPITMCNQHWKIRCTSHFCGSPTRWFYGIARCGSVRPPNWDNNPNMYCRDVIAMRDDREVIDRGQFLFWAQATESTTAGVLSDVFAFSIDDGGILRCKMNGVTYTLNNDPLLDLHLWHPYVYFWNTGDQSSATVQFVYD